MCLIFPSTGQHANHAIGQLLALTQLTVIGWFVDEVATQDSANVQEIQSVMDDIMGAVRDPKKARRPTEHVLGEIARQLSVLSKCLSACTQMIVCRWWLPLIGKLTPHSLERLDHTLESYLALNVQQVKDSLRPRNKTIEEYFKGRQEDIAMFAYAILIELQAPIPEHVWKHPSLVTARSLMNQMVIMDNVRSPSFPYHQQQPNCTSLGYVFIQQGASGRGPS